MLLIYDVLVDPSDPDRVAIVHNDSSLMITTNGGISRGFRDAPPPDPLPYGTAHLLSADPLDPNGHWVFAGRYVWETLKGWKTHCRSATRCDWMRLHGLGKTGKSLNVATALDVRAGVIYVAWCGPLSCDAADDIAMGIDTNVDGEWHRVAGPGIVNSGDPLPNRRISAISIDPADPNHVYAAYGEFRNPWVSQARDGGHVFESIDGGDTWNDITGNLPAAAATDLLIIGGKLVLSTDGGVFVADATGPILWSKLGIGIPNAAVTDLTLTPDGGSIVAATYGRGLWSIPTP